MMSLGLPAEAVAVSSAITMSLKLSDIPSLATSVELVKVMLAFLVAVTTVKPDEAANEPDPVQPLTLKESPKSLLPVKLAIWMPLRLSVKLALDPVRVLFVSV